MPVGTSGKLPSKYATPEPVIGPLTTSTPHGCQAEASRFARPAVLTALSQLKVATWKSFIEVM